jgi:3-hydroxybutyryl-CoA dehydrogenase
LRRAGSHIGTDATLPAETLRIGDDVVALTDGRTLAERRSSGTAGASREAVPTVLLDLARDYATTSVIGATGSAAALAGLAAVLKSASIDVVALDDVAGLVVMRTIAGLVNEAADLMTWTGTSAADIDTAMRLGMAYTQGPLAWADAIGSSRAATVLAHLHEHYGEPRYRRSPRLARAHFGGERFHG